MNVQSASRGTGLLSTLRVSRTDGSRMLPCMLLVVAVLVGAPSAHGAGTPEPNARRVVLDLIASRADAVISREISYVDYTEALARNRYAYLLGPMWGTCRLEEPAFPMCGPIAITPRTTMELCCWEVRPLEIELQLGMMPRYEPDRPSHQNVHISWNGARLKSVELDYSKEPTTVTLDVPEELVRLGPNRITFVCLMPSALVPPKTEVRNPYSRRSFYLRSVRTLDAMASLDEAHEPEEGQPWVAEPRVCYDFVCSAPDSPRLELALADGSSRAGHVLIEVTPLYAPGPTLEVSLSGDAIGGGSTIDLSEYAGREVRLRWITQGTSLEISRAQITGAAGARAAAATPGGPAPPADPDAPETQRSTPNVMIVLLDAWRADHAGFLGYHRDTTPNMDRLAAESIVFENAWPGSCHTMGSVPTLFTGLYPTVHGLNSQTLPNQALDGKYKTLAEAFQEAGYHTAVISAAPFMSKKWNTTQGFAEDLPLFQIAKQRVRPGPVAAETVVNYMTQWVEAGPAQPFFLYVHIIEPHAPYNPPGEWPLFFDPYYQGEVEGSRQFLEKIIYGERTLTERELEHLIARYDANLRYADDCLGPFFDLLRTRGVLDNTILIVTADHGEGFGEHGVFTHTQTTYPEMTHVPLLMRFPDGMGVTPRRLDDLVSLAHLYPTLADFCGLSLPEYPIHGVSLKETLVKGAPVKAKAVYICSDEGPWQFPLHSVRTAGTHTIIGGGSHLREMYLTGADPLERSNMADLLPGLFTRDLQYLNRWLRQRPRETPYVPKEEEEVQIDQETRDELRDLGYL